MGSDIVHRLRNENRDSEMPDLCNEAADEIEHLRGELKQMLVMNDLIDAMALAICNAIRDDHDLPPINSLNTVENPAAYRKQARLALRAYQKALFGQLR